MKDFEKSATDLSDNTTLFTNDVHVVGKGNSNENILTKEELREKFMFYWKRQKNIMKIIMEL